MKPHDEKDESDGPLAEFWRFVRTTEELRDYRVKAAVAAPLVDLLVCLGPSWPNRIAMAVIAATAEISVLMFAFQKLQQKKVADRAFVTSVVLAFVLIFSYMYLFSAYVHSPLGWRNRVIGAGDSAVKEEVLEGIQRLRSEKPDYGIDDALADRGNDPDKIWTNGPLTVIRLLFFANWILLFVCVGVSGGAFVILQKQRAAQNFGKQFAAKKE